jgi:hypothetical protein
MRKFIFCVILLVIGAMLFGAGWNLNHNKESGFDEFREELSSRASKIEELEDSIKRLNAKVGLYEQLLNAREYRAQE